MGEGRRTREVRERRKERKREKGRETERQMEREETDAREGKTVLKVVPPGTCSKSLD